MVELEARERLPDARPARRLERHSANPAQLEEPLEVRPVADEGAREVEVNPPAELHRGGLEENFPVAEVRSTRPRRECQSRLVPVQEESLGETVVLRSLDQVGEEECVPLLGEEEVGVQFLEGLYHLEYLLSFGAALDHYLLLSTGQLDRPDRVCIPRDPPLPLDLHLDLRFAQLGDHVIVRPVVVVQPPLKPLRRLRDLAVGEREEVALVEVCLGRWYVGVVYPVEAEGPEALDAPREELGLLRVLDLELENLALGLVGYLLDLPDQSRPQDLRLDEPVAPQPREFIPVVGGHEDRGRPSIEKPSYLAVLELQPDDHLSRVAGIEVKYPASQAS